MGAAASDTPGVGCCLYRVFNRISGRTFETRSLSLAVKLHSVYQHDYVIYAYDDAGTLTGYVETPPSGTTYWSLVDDRAGGSWDFSGTWSFKFTSGGAYAGTLRSSTTSGDRANFAGFGSSFGIVVSKGPQNGSAHVLLDGQPAGSFNSYAATSKSRMLVRVLSPTHAGDDRQHTITVVNDGTGRIDIDAMGVIHSE